MDFKHFQQLKNKFSDAEREELGELYRKDLIDKLIRAKGACLEIGDHPLRYEIGEMGFYLDTLEEFIEKQEQKQVKQHQKKVERLELQRKNLSEEEKRNFEEFFFWHSDYDYRPSEILIDVLRSSFLISLVSYFEIHLSYVCRNVAIIARSPLKPSELKGNKLERSKKFLEIFGKFTNPSKDDWELITHIYDVRNVLVHNDSRIYDYNYANRLRQFVNQQPSLSLDDPVFYKSFIYNELQ